MDFNKKINFSNTWLRSLLVTVLFLIVQFFGIYMVNKFEYTRGGIGNSLLDFIKLEFWLIAFISFGFLLILRRNIGSMILVFFTTIFFYVFVNEFYIAFKRLPKASEIQEIPELLSTFDISILILILLIVMVYLIWTFSQLKFNRFKLITCFLMFFSIFFIVKIKPIIYIQIYERIDFTYETWDSKKSARSSGYLNFLLYENAKKNYALNQLKEKNITVEALPDPIIKKLQKSNVHIIVLESFYDPNMFEALELSINPMFYKFQKFQQNVSTSPVYGGGTAQAEFEVLTGAPALNKYDNIEFNLFTGSEIRNSLPSKLNRLGYLTIATNALTPDVFNSYKAYQSLGFKNQFYLSGETYLKKKEQDRFIKDSDLLDQNIQFLKQTFKENPDKPVFNYVLGMYGHSPNSLDTSINPILIDVMKDKQSITDDKFKRSINQIYYRTEALAKYIEELAVIDPNSLILIIGDHLPVINKIEKYEYFEDDIYKTIFFLIQNNKSLAPKNNSYYHHDMSDLVLKKLFSEYPISKLSKLEKYEEVLYQATQ
ncbi:sulfatase-like hydrolase/transferase [Nonlabens sp. Asnod3-A02]|uniref:sulfatase-like hydrolase/transferase n=1 Tax=Nonlabens sp. Asnod3-A02 TaxID=3160579 RepID=UPI003864F2DC